MQLKLRNELLDLSCPAVMGIVNVTPDSFYEQSRRTTESEVLRTVEQILREGGQLVDVGGYSSRPSAADIPLDEEIRRLSWGIEAIVRRFPDIRLSVDTFRSAVARHVVKNYDVCIINDIGGGTLDSEMFATVADLGVAYVLMHMRGTPATMAECTNYDNVTAEVIAHLEERVYRLRAMGVNDVIVDPGFGFAKTLEQNYRLLHDLSCFALLDTPLLVGISRKQMIYKLLDTDPQHALNGTTAAHMAALYGGASILRTHDVKEAVEAVKVYCATRHAGGC